MANVCESCGFGAGHRTGRVRIVRLLRCFGDAWHAGDVHALCDDCLSAVDASAWEDAES